MTAKVLLVTLTLLVTLGLEEVRACSFHRQTRVCEPRQPGSRCTCGVVGGRCQCLPRMTYAELFPLRRGPAGGPPKPPARPPPPEINIEKQMEWMVKWSRLLSRA
ncbi:uncharacterized protein LOC143291528 [Babylonia areolata]|uniref:uncharacterized protein LOC143291528 n=1 Tax=Babylonia areolata TaxID=304850 RepID=UPI003FCFCE31